MGHVVDEPEDVTVVVEVAVEVTVGAVTDILVVVV